LTQSSVHSDIGCKPTSNVDKTGCAGSCELTSEAGFFAFAVFFKRWHDILHIAA
jgi:hypothetical protein